MRPMPAPEPGTELGRSIEAITLDFGNTLVPFRAGPSAAVLRATAERAAQVTGCVVADFERMWGEERMRQFSEDVPEGREADLDIRVARVLARLSGRPEPPNGARWDDADHVSAILDGYADAFVRLTPVPPQIEPILRRLAARYPLGLLSNWPLAMAAERFIEAAGWAGHFRAVVISQRVGAVKPWRRIFDVAAAELGVPSGPGILHVGDDLGADVAGAQALGWRAAWVRARTEDSVLPKGPPAPHAVPDLTIDTVAELEAALGLPADRRVLLD